MSIEAKGFWISLALLAGVVGFLVWNRKQMDKSATVPRSPYGSGK